jgi:hypothetical protein
MEAQDALYEQAPAGAKPKTVIVIEEAHEFVSAGRGARLNPRVAKELRSSKS